jgi:hypothetical protein
MSMVRLGFLDSIRARMARTGSVLHVCEARPMPLMASLRLLRPLPAMATVCRGAEAVQQRNELIACPEATSFELVSWRAVFAMISSLSTAAKLMIWGRKRSGAAVHQGS